MTEKPLKFSPPIHMAVSVEHYHPSLFIHFAFASSNDFVCDKSLVETPRHLFVTHQVHVSVMHRTPLPLPSYHHIRLIKVALRSWKLLECPHLW